MENDSNAGGGSSITRSGTGQSGPRGSSAVPIRTEAARVDVAIVTRDGDLKLDGAVYFATDEDTWEKRALFGLIRREYRATYGFRSGLLRVELVNATAPIADRYGSLLEASAEVEAGTTTDRSTEFGVEVGGESGVPPTVGGNFGVKRAWSSTSTERVVTHPPTVVTKGPDDSPAWEYRSYGPKCLRGRAPGHEIALAKLIQFGSDVVARATVLIDSADVTCEAADRLGKSNPKQSAVLKQAFAQYLLKKWKAKGLEKIGVSTTRAFFSSFHGAGGTATAEERP